MHIKQHKTDEMRIYNTYYLQPYKYKSGVWIVNYRITSALQQMCIHQDKIRRRDRRAGFSGTGDPGKVEEEEK